MPQRGTLRARIQHGGCKNDRADAGQEWIDNFHSFIIYIQAEPNMNTIYANERTHLSNHQKRHKYAWKFRNLSKTYTSEQLKFPQRQLDT